MRDGPIFYFHVSREARDRYDFPRELYSTTGNVISLDLHSARILARKINDFRAASRGVAAQLVRAGDMNAMGLIDEVLHYVAGLYRKSVERGAFEKALGFLETREGREHVDATLRLFVTLFPPPSVLDGTESVDEYLRAEEGGVSRRSSRWRRCFMLSLANANPAFDPFTELFDDASVEESTSYARIVDGVREFFRTLPGFGPENEDLVAMLAAPCGRPRTRSRDSSSTSAPAGATCSGICSCACSPGMDLLREEARLRLRRLHAGAARSLRVRGPGGGGGGLQRGPGLDAARGDDGQERAGLAGPALAPLRAGHPPARPGARRGAGHPGAPRVHRAVADRRLGAQRRLARDQAADGQPRGRGVGLLPVRLRHRRRARRRGRRWRT